MLTAWLPAGESGPWRLLAAATAIFAASGLLVLLAAYVFAGNFSFSTCSGHRFGYTSWFSNWDGQWYQYIVQHGYHYSDQGGYGPQVFFPLYPLLGKLVAAVTPLFGQVPLVAVSWGATWAFCIAWIAYAARRIEGAGSSGALWGLALVLLWPASYFLRVAYTEALYLFLLTVFFLGCSQRWHPALLVLVTGLLTATRPTGVLACVVLAVTLFRRYPTTPIVRRVIKSALIAVISAWGLWAYLAYLYLEFGDPLLFLSKQAAWNYAMPSNVFFVRWQEMLSLRPVWEFLIDGSLSQPLSYSWNLQNRLFWLVGVCVVAIGAGKRWLNLEESIFVVLTLALIYYTHGPKNMESVGRYVSTLVPIYLVLTRWLLATPMALRLGLLGLSALGLVYQSAQFSQWGCTF